jgi:hypothetical protein
VRQLHYVLDSHHVGATSAFDFSRKSSVSGDTSASVYVPLALELSLSERLPVPCGPVVHSSGIHLLVTSECSFITEINILVKGLIGARLLLCPLTKLYQILKIVPMKLLVWFG